MHIDLHMHSTFSDGMCTPTRLVEMAVEQKLSAIGLTDHDCMDGIGEAVDEGAKNNVEIIPGVELSSEFNDRDLHILGYCIDPNHAGFQEMLRKFRDTRYQRGLKIIEKLSKLGIDLDQKDVMEKAGRGSLGRPHIAAVLVEKGHVSRTGEAFDKYIAEGGPAYVKKYKLSPRDAVEHIHDAGGLAFVAHPGISVSRIDDLKILLEHGFDGIEVYHPGHFPGTIKELTALAEELGLLVSGGTDFHGFKDRDMPIGSLNIPYEVLDTIKKRASAR
jgi:predicted metal-dependent phosphoesterase TrpH